MTLIKQAIAKQEAKLIMPTEAQFIDLSRNPDSGTVVCALEGNEVGFIDPSLAVATKTHGIVDKYGDALEFKKIQGLAGNMILATNLQVAKLLRAGESGLVVEKSWDLLSEKSTANALGVNADSKGNVKAVSEVDYLHVLAADGTKKTVHDPDNYFWGIAVSASGNYVANGRKDGTVEVRDSGNLQANERYEGLTAEALALAFSPDERYLVAADDRAACVLWDRQTKKAVIIPGCSKIIGIFWMSDGSGFISVCLPREVNFIDLEDLYSRNSQEFCLPAFHLDPYGPLYIQSAVLRDDANLFVFVEKCGVVHIKLG